LHTAFKQKAGCLLPSNGLTPWKKENTPLLLLAAPGDAAPLASSPLKQHAAVKATRSWSSTLFDLKRIMLKLLCDVNRFVAASAGRLAKGGGSRRMSLMA
jgi:hypothetical protein